MISDARLEDFRHAYKKSYDEDISIEGAREMALNVMLLYELLARPLPGEEEDHHPPQEHDFPSSPLFHRVCHPPATRSHPNVSKNFAAYTEKRTGRYHRCRCTCLTHRREREAFSFAAVSVSCCVALVLARLDFS
jgi:hypothetical protein